MIFIICYIPSTDNSIVYVVRMAEPHCNYIDLPHNRRNMA